MQTISVNELQNNLGLYLKKVKDGDEIVIEENNGAIARILPFDNRDELEEDEKKLVAEGLMSLPKKEMSEDFWEMDAPQVSLEKIIKTIRAERDED